ncbi:MAG TPA: hypothetical protein VGC98_15750 [Thermoleophilaceae bacterium]|jgi:hypothetical protein
MPTMRRTIKALPALALVALAVPSSAFGQATRTWVSGVGDDANPCSRTAPCKTFAGAISKTANGGEINCIDPGGFGGVTIGKSLTIKCHYTEGGVLVQGTNAIVVNATASDTVTLRGLDINGIGTGAQTSLVGVKVLAARKVRVFDSEIYRFQAGVDVAPTSAQTSVVLKNNHIHDNGVGVITAPGNNAISFVTTTLRYNDVQDNTCGVVTSSFGTNASTPNANTDCGAGTSATLINKTAVTEMYHNGVNDNGFGVFTRGSSATAEIAYNDITGNSSFGLRHIDSSTIKTFTPATNAISGNAASDATNGSTPLQKRHAKRVSR